MFCFRCVGNGRWAWVIEKPETDLQRRFCTQLLQRLLRLSYWENVHQVSECACPCKAVTGR